MAKVEQSIECNVPVRVAYDQWTQFEEFPRFMEGVESCTQLSDDRLHWVVEIAGVRREFDAKITEQMPDKRIAWCSMGDVKLAGVVDFHRINDDCCNITLGMEFEPEGFAENAAVLLGIVQTRCKGDLGRFKEFIEARKTPTGAWRGTIEGKT